MRPSGATELSSLGYVNFVFPARYPQLCEQPTDPNQFYVQDRINVGQLSEARLQQEVDTVMERLTGNKALNILQNDIFDSIYSVIFYLEDVSLPVRKELI